MTEPATVATMLMPPRSPFAGRVMPLDSPEFDPSLIDPFEVVEPLLKGQPPPSWIILGGLGDTEDGKAAIQRWPNAKLLGIDPDSRMLDWQRQEGRGWPATAPLVCKALSDCVGREQAYFEPGAFASLCAEHIARFPREDYATVETTTLDQLQHKYGPFERSILWLDCEGYDYKALVGGDKLLRSGRVLLVNVEVWYKLEATNRLMELYLSVCGYQRKLIWFRQWWGHNEVWGR